MLGRHNIRVAAVPVIAKCTFEQKTTVYV